jgi:hypothetical protein
MKFGRIGSLATLRTGTERHTDREQRDDSDRKIDSHHVVVYCTDAKLPNRRKNSFSVEAIVFLFVQWLLHFNHFYLQNPYL